MSHAEAGVRAEESIAPLPAPAPASVVSVREVVKFTLPSLPPSMNSLYNVMFGMRRVELKPEARLWKTKMKEFIPLARLVEGEVAQVKLTFYCSWFYKNGRVRQKDVQNMVKLTLDAISEKCGFDDSFVWQMEVSKVDSEKERIEVELVRRKLG